MKYYIHRCKWCPFTSKHRGSMPKHKKRKHPKEYVPRNLTPKGKGNPAERRAETQNRYYNLQKERKAL